MSDRVVQDETFLPETELRAYSYRGAYGQTVSGPRADSMNPGVGGLSGLAGLSGLTAPSSALGLASLGLAIFGSVKAADAAAAGKPMGGWVAVVAAGLFGAFYSASGKAS